MITLGHQLSDIDRPLFHIKNRTLIWFVVHQVILRDVAQVYVIGLANAFYLLPKFYQSLGFKVQHMSCFILKQNYAKLQDSLSNE